MESLWGGGGIKGSDSEKACLYKSSFFSKSSQRPIHFTLLSQFWEADDGISPGSKKNKYELLNRLIHDLNE